MFYRWFMYYLKLKIFQLVLAHFKKSKFIKSKNLKTVSMLAYGMELLAALFIKPKKGRAKKYSKL